MYVLTNRRKSFQNIDDIKDKEAQELATEGFYLTDAAGNMKCSFCEMTFKLHERGVAIAVHKISGLCKKREIEKQDTQINVIYDEINYDVQKCEDGELRDVATLKKCKYPDFMTFDKRIKSFREWPVQIVQKPRDLATAGFFYNGHGDRVTCYFCGLKLVQWKRLSHIWISHINQNINCDVLRLSVGQNYITKITNRINNISLKNETAISLKDIRSNYTRNEDKTKCIICEYRPRNIAFQNCDHFISCVVCYNEFNYCPICEAPITKILRVFL